MSVLGDEIRKERLERVFDAYNEASAEVSKAIQTESRARAAVVRVMLLDIAADYPKVKAFWWNVSWEYDDEGSYYASTNMYFSGIDYEDGDAYYAVEEALYEPAGYLNEGAMEYLGPQETPVTIAELRALSL